MRFAGKYGRLVVQIVPERVEAYATGASRVIQSPVLAVFMPVPLEAFERELVLSRWTFSGLYQEQDEVTTVPPDYRIGLFDSIEAQELNGWSDEIRERVEAELTSIATRFDHVMVLPRTTVPPPWPTYDEFKGSVGALLKRLDDDGYDLEQVLAYEKAMQNRPPLVAALEGKLYGFEVEEKAEEVIA
jgi:hypothetical protein